MIKSFCPTTANIGQAGQLGTPTTTHPSPSAAHNPSHPRRHTTHSMVGMSGVTPRKYKIYIHIYMRKREREKLA